VVLDHEPLRKLLARGEEETEMSEELGEVRPDNIEDRIANTVGRIGTFKEEMAEMPKLQRRIVYISMFCMFMLFVQSIFIMPVILIKYGWGYNVG
jgi:hypothetical protein